MNLQQSKEHHKSQNWLILRICWQQNLLFPLIHSKPLQNKSLITKGRTSHMPYFPFPTETVIFMEQFIFIIIFLLHWYDCGKICTDAYSMQVWHNTDIKISGVATSQI